MKDATKALFQSQRTNIKSNRSTKTIFQSSNYNKDSSEDEITKVNSTGPQRSRTSLEKLRTTIPSYDLQVQELMKAQVIHFKNLEEFYVSRAGSKFDLEQQNLSREMQNYYNQEKNTVQVEDPAKGIYAAVFMNDIWSRCLITEVKKNNCEVFLVDLGVTENVSISAMKQLDQKFFNTMQTAIR